MAKKISCGIIYRIKDTDKFLMEHITGKHEWTIPRGVIDEEDPSPAHTAARELYEESGIKVNPLDLQRIGDLYEYIPSKDLILFYYEVDGRKALKELGSLRCISLFQYKYTDKNGETQIKVRQEVDGYKYVKISEIADYANPNMTRVLNQFFANLEDMSIGYTADDVKPSDMDTLLP